MWELCKTRTKYQVLTCPTFMYSWLVMKWSLTMAGLPRAGKKSKPHDYKQKYKKWRTFRKHGLKREKVLKILDKKEQSKFLDISKTLGGTHGP